MKNILITISIIALLTATLQVAPASAQSGLFDYSSGNQAICRGTRDYGAFLSTLIDYDDFTEYWKDIFVRYSANICQYEDIDSLLTRIGKVRKQLREAFYVCADTSKMKDTYYKLETELFYLRNYVNTDNGSFEVINEAQLVNDLQENFVINKGYFSSEEMTGLFDQFKAKYESRLETYKNCTDQSWENLVTKWNEFKDTAGGFGPAIKQAGASISKRYERMANTPLTKGGGFFGGILDAKINGLEPMESLGQIYDELKRNLPEGYTFSDVQAAQTVAENKRNEEVSIADYEAQYQALYAETSGEYTNQIIYRLSVLDKIIKDTSAPMNQTYQCTRRINNKQC